MNEKIKHYLIEAFCYGIVFFLLVYLSEIVFRSSDVSWQEIAVQSVIYGIGMPAIIHWINKKYQKDK
ncbi:MAG: hypothetical protein J5506_11030 [Prevotella sp.]|nr:hypothetical protein [Prevotella sp.]